MAHCLNLWIAANQGSAQFLCKPYGEGVRVRECITCLDACCCQDALLIDAAEHDGQPPDVVKDLFARANPNSRSVREGPPAYLPRSSATRDCASS
jgi:hypothetical protein